MTKDAVHAVAQGRVWSGDKALNNGLVDVIGDLEDAISIAANSAGIDSYNVKEYPTVKDPTQQLIDKLSGKDSSNDKIGAFIKNDLNEFYPYYKEIKDIKQMQGVQAKMPYYIDIK